MPIWGTSFILLLQLIFFFWGGGGRGSRESLRGIVVWAFPCFVHCSSYKMNSGFPSAPHRIKRIKRQSQSSCDPVSTSRILYCISALLFFCACKQNIFYTALAARFLLLLMSISPWPLPFQAFTWFSSPFPSQTTIYVQMHKNANIFISSVSPILPISISLGRNITDQFLGNTDSPCRSQTEQQVFSISEHQTLSAYLCHACCTRRWTPAPAWCCQLFWFYFQSEAMCWF